MSISRACRDYKSSKTHSYFIHEFNHISVSVTRGIKYFLAVDSVLVAYLLQLSIVSQHKHEQ